MSPALPGVRGRQTAPGRGWREWSSGQTVARTDAGTTPNRRAWAAERPPAAAGVPATRRAAARIAAIVLRVGARERPVGKAPRCDDDSRVYARREPRPRGAG